MMRLFARSAIRRLPGSTPGKAVGGGLVAGFELAGGANSSAWSTAFAVELDGEFEHAPTTKDAPTIIGARQYRMIEGGRTLAKV